MKKVVKVLSGMLVMLALLIQLNAINMQGNLPVAAASYNTVQTSVVQPSKENSASITVHYYKPNFWGAPNIYYYDDTVTPIKEGAEWPGIAMTSEGDNWYSYTINGWDKAYVLFNSGSVQIPAAGEAGYLVTGNCWIKNGVITSDEPATDLVAVTFIVNDAIAVWGQRVYIAGNIPELGSWNTANAVGPASRSNYPTWTITVNLPAGTSIEFKAIKKDASGAVVWQGGSNKTYTVPASGAGSTTISW